MLTSAAFWVLFVLWYTGYAALAHKPRLRAWALLILGIIVYWNFSGALVCVLLAVGWLDFHHARMQAALKAGDGRVALGKAFERYVRVAIGVLAVSGLTELVGLLVPLSDLPPVLGFAYAPERRYLLLGIAVAFFLQAVWAHRADLQLARAAKPRQVADRLAVTLSWASIFLNLTLLFAYKYLAAFSTLVVEGLGLGLQPIDTAGWWVPVGLSYFVFKSMAYSIDVYNEEIETPESHFVSYAAFLVFFPAILAGPIMRGRAFFEQLNAPVQSNSRLFATGLWLVMLGFAKKTIVADYLHANYIDRMFTEPGQYGSLECWMATLLYGIYIFFDFSAYTELAVGAAALVGLKIEPNFNEPFKALNLADFWRRWHMSMSSWFADYLFTPLHFSLRSWRVFGLMVSVVITFTLSGLWHGAHLTLVLWGLAHGCWQAAEIALLPLRNRLAGGSVVVRFVYRLAGRILVLFFLLNTFVLFYYTDFSRAVAFYDRLYGTFPALDRLPDWVLLYAYPAAVAALALIVILLPTRFKAWVVQVWLALPVVVQVAVVVLGVFLAWQFKLADAQPFVYLEF